MIFVLAELGDYQADELEPNYLSGMTLIPGQTEEMERKIAELHKLHMYVVLLLFLFDFEIQISWDCVMTPNNAWNK